MMKSGTPTMRPAMKGATITSPLPPLPSTALLIIPNVPPARTKGSAQPIAASPHPKFDPPVAGAGSPGEAGAPTIVAHESQYVTVPSSGFEQRSQYRFTMRLG